MRRCVGRVLVGTIGSLNRVDVTPASMFSQENERIGQWISPAQQHRSHGRVRFRFMESGYGPICGCASDGGG